MQSSQVADQLFVQTHHARLERRCFAQALDMAFHIFMCFSHDLLDPAGVDPAVLDQFLERHLGDLAANAVKTCDDHHSRRVVDDQVDSRRFLERADVPPFAADDPPLHVVAGNVHRAHGHFRRVRGGISLNRRRQDLAALLSAALLHKRLVLEDTIPHVGGQLGFQSSQQQLARLL